MNQPEPDEEDLDELKSEMEKLVGKAEKIEANLEDIENMDSKVQIIVKDFDGSEDDLSLDDEVRRITSDQINGGTKGMSYIN